MVVKAGQKIEGHKIVEAPDPIVLHEIENGYIIVTAWGPEASDPDVVNPLSN